MQIEIAVSSDSADRTTAGETERGVVAAASSKRRRDRRCGHRMVGMGTAPPRAAGAGDGDRRRPPHPGTFEALADLFAQHRGDKPVTFQLLVKDHDRRLRVRAQVSAHIRVKPTTALVQEVEKICGIGAVALR